ncbi:TPA: hypothetical protein N0F65_007503 [Lagenidium giganteum]|uniref:Hook C-terminal domain-containing protein n=1 Tax=Lagenidium giganteum TaxID=4803 RepID=A0AAV2ZHP7_9STRA|nr:TPA: hypothetical protein N0F65_007503 [Lagenidium giganteum]
MARFPTLWSDAKTSVEIRDDWDVIIAVLEAVHEAPLYLTKNDLPFSRMTENACNSRSFERLMEFLLGALVQGEERATVVRDIMTMDDVVQTDLKLAIERVMNYEPEPPQAQEPSGEVSDLWDNRDKATETQRSDPASPISNQISGSPRAHTPLYLSRNADLERAQRENNILKDENIHMVRELEDAMQKYENARQTNKELEEQVERLMLGLEVEVMKKERAVRSLYDERLQQLQKELDETRQELHDKSLVASEVKSLRDEVDLLRPAADKTAKLESTLSKYRTKIEELTCVKEQLRVRI